MYVDKRPPSVEGGHLHRCVPKMHENRRYGSCAYKGCKNTETITQWIEAVLEYLKGL